MYLWQDNFMVMVGMTRVSPIHNVLLTYENYFAKDIIANR